MASHRRGCALCAQCLPVMKRCARCRQVFYCSKDCQERHWQIHRRQCSTCPTVNEKQTEGCFEDRISKNLCIHQEETISKDMATTEGMETVEIRNAVTIRVRHNRIKHEIQIPKNATEEESFALISKHLRIPAEKMRLICKGKLLDKENISHFLASNAIFQAFGEQAECEDGLEVKDIEVLMAQMSVERNVAIQALRKTGDLIDAIFYVSDGP